MRRGRGGGRVLAVVLATASVSALAAAGARAATARQAAACPASIHRFVNALTEIDGRLGVGLNFRSYASLLSNANVAYSRIATSRLPYPCLSLVAVPAEHALNEYTIAYNIWHQCVSALNCGDGSNRRIQFRWHRAHNSVTTAVNNLDP